MWPFANGKETKHVWSGIETDASSVIFLCETSANEGDLVPDCFKSEYHTNAYTLNLNPHIWDLSWLPIPKHVMGSCIAKALGAQLLLLV